jgi:hypothetical protein
MRTKERDNNRREAGNISVVGNRVKNINYGM